MLPGVGGKAIDFVEQGMIAALHERRCPVDVIATTPDLDLYLDGSIAAEMHRSIIQPARRVGYTRIWTLGISLGGLAALLYASEKFSCVDGMILLAPFLGTQGTIAEIVQAGSLDAWRDDTSAATAVERQALSWLKRFLSRQLHSPEIYLGYGTADRFAKSHSLLGARLPQHRVVTSDGGHDWNTWADLWLQLLDSGSLPPFQTTISKQANHLDTSK